MGAGEGIAALNAGSNGDVLGAAKHMGKAGGEVGTLALEGFSKVKQAFTLVDERRVDFEGNNALHYILLPLLKKDSKGKWVEPATQEYRNIVDWILNHNGNGCDPMCANNDGKTPKGIVAELIADKQGRDEKECKELDEINAKMTSFMSSEKNGKKVKTALAIAGGWQIAGYIAVPLLAWNWVSWICQQPVKVLGWTGIPAKLGLDGPFGTYFLTFCAMCGIVYLLKKKIKNLFSTA